MATVNLSAPWINYYKEINALFQYDPEVHVIYNDETKTISLYVDNVSKADALSDLLPESKEFGSIVVYVDIIPANNAKNPSDDYNLTVYERAFKDNPAFSYIHIASGIYTYNVMYVVFANRVVQYFTDDLSDVNGNRSTLYQEIAKDVLLPQSGVYYCTDIAHPVYNHSVSLGKPVSRWP